MFRHTLKVCILSECLNLYFDEFGASDWDFYYDVRALYNDSVVERKWLKNVIKKELDKTEKGLLITSDMGFGKSSMVADIVCSSNKSVWYGIKKHVLTYHLCQHDVEMSREPTVFIRNIAATLSKRYGFINKTIKSDNITDLFLSRTHCSKDPIGCFDRLVVKPLRFNINLLGDVTLLVLLDAADECEIDGKKDIVSVISRRLSQLPLQIKFLVTSRDLASVRHKLTDLRHISMNSYTEETNTDLSNYIRFKTGHKDNTDLEKKFLRLSKRNFLFLKLYLENCMQLDTCSSDNIPSSLSQVYRSNLERIFGVDGEHFSAIAKSLFEILCTSKKPMTLQLMAAIIDISHDTDGRTIHQYIKNKMIHFLHGVNGNFTLIHKSLNDFFFNLTPESPFYIDIRSGHVKIALYAMVTVEHSTYDLIEIAYHVAYSFDIALENMFIFFFKENARYFHHNLLLHEMAQKVNSYRTANLTRQLLSYLSIDTLNINGETAAFVAASYGNAKTLEWFLDNGADVHFEKDKYQKRINVMTNYYMVEECRFVFFCGYNLLEIAAQNGHVDVVVAIMKKNISINHRTWNDLTAVDLATENGHVAVVVHLLSSNQSHLLQYPFYKASENGHTKIVELLLSRGAKDVCIPCSSSYYSIDNGLRLIDKWQLIVCESALHAAVRNCHLDVVKILLSEKENALECTDRSGMTPLLSSIKNNCSAAFEFLLNNGANVTKTCEHVPGYTNTRYLSDIEKEKYFNYTCPDGARISHILAIYYDRDILKIFLQKNTSLWNAKDKRGLTPLHYSYCSHRSEGISTISELQTCFNFLARSKNGSTPYHMAAYCKSKIPHHIHYFKVNKVPPGFPLNHGMPDVLDNDGRSIVHYFFIGNQTSNFDNCLLLLYMENKINMTRTDKFGRNFLHYAVTVGSITQIEYIFEHMTVTGQIQVLSQRDVTGETPLEKAFNCLQIQMSTHRIKNDIYEQKILKLPDRLLLVFSTIDGNANFSVLLEPEEKMNLLLLGLYKQNVISNINVTNLMYIAAKGSSLYSILMLRQFYPQEFLNIRSNPVHVFQLLHLYRGMYLADLILSKDLLFERCNQTYINDPLTAMIMDTEDRFWIYANDNEFFYSYFANINSSFLNTCFDKEGYNLLHRAAIGGNMPALKFLVNKGMNIFMLTKMNETLLDLLIKHSQYRVNGECSYLKHKKESFYVRYYTNDINDKGIVYEAPLRTLCKHDEAAAFVLSKIRVLSDFNITYWRAKCCQPHQERLGLVQIAAAKGLIKFILTAQEIFGKRVMNCYNQFTDISPYNLAKQNNQMELIDLFDCVFN